MWFIYSFLLFSRQQSKTNLNVLKYLKVVEGNGINLRLNYKINLNLRRYKNLFVEKVNSNKQNIFLYNFYILFGNTINDILKFCLDIIFFLKDPK